MNLWKLVRRLAATATLAFAAVAQGAPVTLTLSGTITGYHFIDLGAVAGLTVGTPVNLSVTFNETWSDGSYSFADPLGPVSGSATVGTHAYSLTGADPNFMTISGGMLSAVGIKITGTGPVLAGGDFFGFASFTPALALDSLALGYGFTTVFPGGSSVTSYGYALITPDDYQVTPGGPNAVPAPATLSLALLGLLAASCARRRRG